MRKLFLGFCLVLTPLLSANSMTVGVSPLLHFPYGASTQKDDDGGTNILSFHPGLAVDFVIPLFSSTVFAPEIGYVMHLREEDGYSKKTAFILYDFAYRVNPKVLLRYGIGTFMTKIGGDGGAITLNNGTGTATFYRPGETVTSYTTTLNLGTETLVGKSGALRAETFTSGILSSVKRKVSYTLQFIYYF